MSVVIENMDMAYGGTKVIDGLSATFESEAISVLLGSSGCGKTTTLRCIAGLETPSTGTITIHGRTVYCADRKINLPPERRALGMVFQSYAIWPHMTVFENVALPLKAQGMASASIRRKVEDTLRLVGLAGFAERGATALSGGQQQRVAIARSIASNPQLILLDEPLSNLDAKLRIAMRREIRQLQRKLKSTVVFVTHDQEEAMSLADSIFLFDRGRIVQHGEPQDLYKRPASKFVAEFFGKANLIPVKLQAQGSKVVAIEDRSKYVLARMPRALAPPPESSVVAMIRPEAWSLAADPQQAVSGTISEITRLGDRLEMIVQTALGEQCVVSLGYERAAVGDQVRISVEPDRIHLIGTQ